MSSSSIGMKVHSSKGLLPLISPNVWTDVPDVGEKIDGRNPRKCSFGTAPKRPSYQQYSMPVIMVKSSSSTAK